jgi:RNA polymerase subunit RPABC4/transcription elongation factor Spt4
MRCSVLAIRYRASKYDGIKPFINIQALCPDAEGNNLNKEDGMNNRLFCAVIVVLSLFSGCKSTRFASQWRDRDIIIDGSTSEWAGLIQYPEDSKVGIGVVNDDVYLYL